MNGCININKVYFLKDKVGFGFKKLDQNALLVLKDANTGVLLECPKTIQKSIALEMSQKTLQKNKKTNVHRWSQSIVFEWFVSKWHQNPHEMSEGIQTKPQAAGRGFVSPEHPPHLRWSFSKLASARSSLALWWMSLWVSILWSSDSPSTLWMKTSKLMSGFTL